MKKLLPYLAPMALILSIGFYFLYNSTIIDVQTVPNDSLAIGHDRSLKINDTVTVTGRVVAPAVVNASGNDFRILMRGSTSRTIYLQDTSNNLFGGIIVRQADTISNTGILNLDSGMKVTLTGIVQEFPDIISSGSTQLNLSLLDIIQVQPTVKKRPAPIQVNVSEFDSLGIMKFSAEKYEGMYVQINNVTIGPQSPLGSRNIRRLIDAQGNFIYLRDFSNFYSIGPSPNWGWTNWAPPSIGASVNYIRGVIVGSAYADGNNGLYPYVIVPIYPNDFQLGNTPPFISSVSRNPGVPKPGNTVNVNAVTTDTLDNPLSVDSCQMYYRINRGAYTKIHMSPSGNIYSGQIPAQGLGTLVEYFIKAKDNQGATRLNPSDTSRSTYFYYVRNSDTMSIKDIQYTPNNGGFSAYNGYSVYTEGVVTADTSDIPAFSFSGNGGGQTSPRRVIIQDPAIAGGWSGVWVSGNATDALVKGQRVKIYGQVTESNGMTFVQIATSGDITVVSSGNPLPGFENITPGVVADNKLDGDTTAEKWESVLVKFPNQVIVSCINAPSNSGCTSEFPLPDTAFRRNFGEIYVVQPGENIEARIELQDGNHNKVNGWDPALANYYNQGNPGSLMWKWDGLSYLQGVLYFGFSHYKLIPRTNTDFGTVIGVEPIGEIATQFWMKQNYPNPFNPTTNIIYNLPVSAEVSLKVYNLLGQEVMTLVNGIQGKGKHEAMFSGGSLASGMYIYSLEATAFDGSKFKDVKKMVLVK
jgi:hypothetical protein